MKYFSVLLVLVSTAFMGITCLKQDMQGSKSERIVGELFKQMAQELSMKYNMQPIGTGVAMPEGIVGHLGLDFQLQGPIEKERAREILIKCAERFVYAVNSKVEIHPFLKNDPFTIDNIGVVLFIYDNSGRELYDPSIAVASITRGELTYYTNDKDNQNQYKSEITESYSDALRLLQNSDQV